LPPTLAASTIAFVDRDVVEAVELLADHFTHVELNFENMHRRQVDYRAVLERFRDALKVASSRGVKPVALHAPYEEYFLQPLGRGVEEAVREAKRFIDLAAGYGVRYVVFHPFSSQRVGSDRVYELNRYFFTAIADYATGYGVYVAVENTVRARPWNNVETLLRLIRGAKARNLVACLDVGHAIVNNQDPASILGGNYDVIGVVHLHDNAGRSDDHLPPGCGVADWFSLARALKSMDTGRAAVLEIVCGESSETCLHRLLLSKLLVEKLVSL
jgi:sugar phosphate isomerase/epimerase